jgi:hypothetical protein
MQRIGLENRLRLAPAGEIGCAIPERVVRSCERRRTCNPPWRGSFD